MVFHRLLQTKGRIIAPVFPIRPDSKVSAIHKRSPGAGCEDVSKLAKCNMVHALLVNNRSRLNLIPTYMYNPAVALRDTVIELEVAMEGGKDSLSMAAQAGGETVKALANLVISHWRGNCSFVGTGKGRLGGFALAQFFYQLPLCGLVILAWTLKYLKRAFNATQDLIGKKPISAGHDIGVIVSLL
ncbi:hypothetical protein SELMODRAFT_432211 [Selaginella moellendorffii]|uniref:Uncharacterized protein n=1 Tax=Selaginella moellendorffii TaxID=88036 RepID=D8TFB1_SELML|nr:hypothetical protein SELMODRAFT_432211 [Selaginella moellendorffii]